MRPLIPPKDISARVSKMIISPITSKSTLEVTEKISRAFFKISLYDWRKFFDEEKNSDNGNSLFVHVGRYISQSGQMDLCNRFCTEYLPEIDTEQSLFFFNFLISKFEIKLERPYMELIKVLLRQWILKVAKITGDAHKIRLLLNSEPRDFLVHVKQLQSTLNVLDLSLNSDMMTGKFLHHFEQEVHRIVKENSTILKHLTDWEIPKIRNRRSSIVYKNSQVEAPEFYLNTAKHWKLDMVENDQRMRKKLCENLDFDDHKEASARRDTNEMSLSDPASPLPVIDYQHIEWDSVDEVELDEPVTTIFECDLIQFMDKRHGRIRFTSHCFIFEEKSIFETIEIDSLQQIHQRRYLLQNSAVELFLTDRKTFLFNFENQKTRNMFYKKILALRPPNLLNADAKSPKDKFKKSITEKWLSYEVSNFEYLMELNTLAGRTYNDLTQYPVMPWILTDYLSETIDLRDPNVFRDLSKPVGALNENRLKQFLDRYEQFEDPSGKIKKFHYGTHYSSAASVLFYMLRVEPFTTMHIELQSRKFDHADRQFHSIKDTWNNCLASTSDVKELIPEFFYFSEFLVNANQFDLGVKQNGDRVDDVVLPPWCESAEDFIRIHREALESDFVSNTLNEWIDLIFGYKQKGEEAIKACNVFYYLTYEGEVNIESIVDEAERKSIESQINNFGQTPCQLLTRPHPKRVTRATYAASFLKRFRVSEFKVRQFKLNLQKVDTAVSIRIAKITSKSFFGGVSEKLLVIDQDGVEHIFDFVPKPLDGIPFSLEWNTAEKKNTLPFAYGYDILTSTFAPFPNKMHYLAAGLWDYTFRLISDKTVSNFSALDLVNCVAVSEDGLLLASCGMDTAVRVWSGMKLKHMFYSHISPLIAVAVSSVYNVCVSLDWNNNCLVHDLTLNRVSWELKLDSDKVKIDRALIRISSQGDFVVSKDQSLYIFSLNGKLKLKESLEFSPRDILLSKNGQFVFFATLKQILLFKLFPWSLIRRIDSVCEVHSLALDNSECFLFAGGSEGKLSVFKLE